MAGASVTTLQADRFWDESGTEHVHDPNVHTMFYTCDRGHRWDDREQHGCPAGGCTWNPAYSGLA